MAQSANSVDSRVLQFVVEQNRPLNAQNVADVLQKYGIKKTTAQKALDAFATSGQISYKDYGKQRIYLARQDQFQTASNEELDVLRNENKDLQEELQKEQSACAQLDSSIRSMHSTLTLEQASKAVANAEQENHALEGKLHKMREGTVLLSVEDRRKLDAQYTDMISAWRKRRRMFTELFSMITEQMDKSVDALKEELGIETDTDAGISLDDFASFSETKKARR